MADKGVYNILVIEDNAGDFALVEEFLLEQIAAPVIVHAKTFKTAHMLLSNEEHKFNIVLLDLSLPDKTVKSLIQEVVALCPTTPVIVLTGYADFEFGVKSLSLGISDYILKEELTSISLYKSIKYSSERKKGIAALEESEKRYSDLFHLSPLPMWVVAQDLCYLDANNAAVKNYGYSLEEFLSMTVKDIRLPEKTHKLEDSLEKLNGNQEQAFVGIYQHQKKNGDIINVEVQNNYIQYKGEKARIVLANDVTERLNYIAAIEKQNEKLQEIAWMQSHVVRAPLARIMGFIHLMNDIEHTEAEKKEVTEYILTSARELDEIIRSISDKTGAVNF